MRPMIEGPTCACIRKITGMFSSFTVELQVGVSLRAARTNLHALHAAKEIYIAAWTRVGSRGPWFPMYRFGQEKDANKPKPVSNAKRMREVRKDPVIAVDEIMSKRAKRLRIKALLRREA